jgi:hypothetical protein
MLASIADDALASVGQFVARLEKPSLPHAASLGCSPVLPSPRFYGVIQAASIPIQVHVATEMATTLMLRTSDKFRGTAES